jgi:hypothetical protein
LAALVIMTQALKLVITGIVNTFIVLFKDTSLVLIIGLFDLLVSVQASCPRLADIPCSSWEQLFRGQALPAPPSPGDQSGARSGTGRCTHSL